jgi:hypothetical protein
MKKSYPYILIIISLFFVTFLWDKIRIPYDQTNLIQGEFFQKKYNPINEILRFLLFVFIPLFVFLISYLKFNNNETLKVNPYSREFFLRKKILIFNDSKIINKITFILLTIITFDFLIIDFKLHIFELDIFHEGTPLVPPTNYFFKNSFWLSTLYDYGFGGNNLGLLMSKITDHHSIGSIRFAKLFLIFLNKILLVFICRKLSINLNFDKNIKGIFFILLSLLIVGFINYTAPAISYYPPRTCIFLLFILFTVDTLISKNSSFLNAFIVGIFSLVSILWWIDIGIYINAIIIIVCIYLILQKEYLKICYIFTGILSAWFIFLIYFPLNEIKEFFYQIKFILSISGYLLGIEYPTPFSAHSIRETKALLFVIFSGIFVIILNFNKKINLDFSTKIIISVLFISSIIFFQTSMMRSDAPHIKASSGSYMFIFYFGLLYFIFYNLQKLKFMIYFKKFSSNYILIMFVGFFLISNLNILNISNIFNFKKNIHTLIYAEDKLFLNNDYKKFLKYYSEISKNDECVQILSDDVSLPYLLKKPSCTQFFIPAHILIGWNENKFIEQIKKSKSNFILYSSPMIWLNNKANMPNVNLFINDNYYLYNNFLGLKIYKKNNKN